MYGPLLSVLLVGMIPVWGMQSNAPLFTRDIRIAPPMIHTSLGDLENLLTASGVIVVDLESGQTLFRRNIGVSRPMASLTKLMTALLIVEHHSLDEVVTVPRDIDNVVGNVANLPAGEQFTVGNLLSALLIMSANDAAVTLAEFHSGSLEAFANEMNDRAKALGLKDTIYKNPTGLDATMQLSSPRDLAWLAMFVMKIPEIAQRMSTPEATITTLTGKTIALIHTHQLMLEDEREIIAGKTGTTDAAGQCLLSIVEAHGRRYITVLLHSQDRYADMRQVIASLTDSL